MGRPPCERRFGKPFELPIIPFGSMVQYHSISSKDLSRLHQFGSKVLPGMFLGYALHAGRIWKGDLVVADIEELEEMDASEIHAGSLNAKEVLTPISVQSGISTHLGCLCLAAVCDRCFPECAVRCSIPTHAPHGKQKHSGETPASFARTLITPFQRSRAAGRLSDLHPHFMRTGT